MFFGVAGTDVCRFRMLLSVTLLFAIVPQSALAGMTLREAVRLAVEFNPEVTETRANKNAVEQQLNQSLGAFLPTVDLTGEIGSEKFNQPEATAPEDNNKWRNARVGAVVVNQTIFSGLERIHEMYRQAARVDAAALSVLARSEFIALSAIEAYINVRRLGAVGAVARKNVAKHREFLKLVKLQVDGGKSARSAFLQVRERTELSHALLGDIRQQEGDVKADFHKFVGERPKGLTRVRVPSGLPLSRSDAILGARAENSSLRQRDADVDAAYHDYRKTDSLFLPKLSFEGRALRGEDRGGTDDRNDELSGKLKLSWNIFNGGISRARRQEQVERWGQAQIRLDAERRNVIEAVEKAWNAFETSRDRIKALRARTRSTRELVDAYEEEYRASRRGLLDLLDAQRSFFESEIELLNVQAIHKFAAYRILAVMGRLLQTLEIELPEEAYSDKRGKYDVFHRY